MINLLLSGANGKMGQAVTRVAENNDQIRILAGYDINTASNNGFPVFDDLQKLPEKPDVIVDFSHPALFDGLLNYAVENSVPAVICTTGLSAEQISRLQYEAQHIPVFFSANMSLGVNLLIDLVSRAAKFLDGNFDIEIIEKHHNQKIDAPSGTALAIADAISDSVTFSPKYTYDRHSVRQKREKAEIGIHSIRGGNIVGEHDVLFAGTDEVITLTHTATSKEVFAVGAVKAALFLAEQKPGMYCMKDLIDAQQ